MRNGPETVENLSMFSVWMETMPHCFQWEYGEREKERGREREMHAKCYLILRYQKSNIMLR